MKAPTQSTTSGFRHLTTLLVIFLAAMSLAGCGDGMARVKGQVTLDGQPVEGGKDGAYVIVQFLPANGAGPNGAAIADQNGRYTIGTGSHYGVVPGDYVVTCTYRPVHPNDRVPDRKFSDAKTSGMKCTARPGNNEFNISLESPPKTAPRSGA
jgi:hypothetical protein